MESSKFDYSLPADAIAQTPLTPRDSSRLLVNGKTILHKHVKDLPEFLRKGDLVVLNNTRVMHARLNLFKESGGAVEKGSGLHYSADVLTFHTGTSQV